MTPRLMFVCLGGLAGAGAFADLDAGLDTADAAPEADPIDGVVEEPETSEAEALH